MTPTELETMMYNTLLNVNRWLTSGKKISSMDYVKLSGEVLQGIRSYENKLYGTHRH